MDSSVTVCIFPKVYVPVPPVPVPSAVMIEPGRSAPVVSLIVCPTANVPDETAVTVNVLAATLPENAAEVAFAEPISSETICAQEPNARIFA